MVGTGAVFFFFLEEILQNFDLKKFDFKVYKGFFHMKKKDPNSPDLEEFFFLQIIRFLL
jgi:hypothetical protein